MSDPIALARLLQLSSVSLPVGGYAFSQGLEYAIECGWIKNYDDVEQWIQLQLKENLARVDLPIFRGVMGSSEASDWSRFRYLNDLAIASRETKELRLTDTAMGEALYRLLKSLGFTFPFLFPVGTEYLALKKDELSFVSLFAYTAQCWEIPYKEAATGFTWSWLESQVAAATKLVPLGQTQAQQLLTFFQPVIAQTLDHAELTLEENIGGGLPALAIASALHETQYSRLFRS
jgi:urease accessory protein